MIGIDTNILLRLFTDDSPRQTDAALTLLASSHVASIRVSSVVLAELVWVLRASYRLGKPAIIEIIEETLEREELVFESRLAILKALGWYESSKADFADCLVAALNAEHGASPTMTFDQAASELDAFALLISGN